jgi:purine-binding chemotaxis protein CheW
LAGAGKAALRPNRRLPLLPQNRATALGRKVKDKMATTLLDKAKAAVTQVHRVAGEEENKFLTFKLADESYGVEILKVREIIGLLNITAVPQMPVYMQGVINLRGKVIPVVDLRLKFGLDEAEHTEETCIIVVDVGREVGIVVDTVSEVLDIAGKNIEPPPSMGGSVDTSFILGMGKVGDAVKILLDIDRVLSTDELIDIASAADAADSSTGPIVHASAH